MKWMKITIYTILLGLMIACKGPSAGEEPNTLLFIAPNHSDLEYQGRIGQEGDSARVFYWSGTSVKIRFEGVEMLAVLKDEQYKNYFNVIVDGEFSHILRPDTVKKSYVLAEDLSEGMHTIELFKRTEWKSGKTWFYGFQPMPEASVAAIKPKTRRIEFYGNSITAAYAVEDTTGGDSPDSTYTNFYKSYAALTARHFDANYAALATSGIGITVSWVEEIAPEIYDRLDPNDPSSRWDFSQKQPDVVVINLLQNDSWLIVMPEYVEFKKRFPKGAPSIEFVTARYQDFVRNIRGKYPAAHIICMLGNMDITKEGSPWPKYVQEVVDALEDPKIHSLVAPYVEVNGHPRTAEQEMMAKALISLISEKVGWK